MNYLRLIRNGSPVVICLAILLPVLLNSCGSGGSNTGTSTLMSIAIYPTSEEMTTGTTATLKATGTYSDATIADLTTSATWTSSASAVANVGANTGLVTAGSAVGLTTVTASSGVIASSATITVTSATLTNITVSPATMTISKGTTSTFTARGDFSDGTTGDISGVVGWACNSPTVASIDAVGNVTGVGAGTCTINATSGSISASATLTVF